MKTIALAVIAAAIATAAHAQTYGTSQQFGNQTYYQGSVNGQPYTGNTQNFGGQSYTHFYSGGQTTTCTQNRIGSTTYTNCN